MDNQSDNLDNLVTFSPKESKKFRINLLFRIITRLKDFSDSCPECRTFLPEMEKFSFESAKLKLASKDDLKHYFKRIDAVVKHLREKHKLITQDENTGIWLGIGVALGTSVGVSTDNIGVGVALGISLGIAIGKSLDSKAKKENRII